MTKKEAINELIALAVCSDPKLHCDDDCPCYCSECKHVEEDFKTYEAVKLLRGDKNV